MARFVRSTKEFFCVDIFQGNQSVEISSTEINGRFLFTQLFLDILLRLEQKVTDKDELIVKCTELFANNPSELQKLQEFHMKYEPEHVFEWYTKDMFIYRQVNKALRTQNIDLLFLYRFFLQDLQNQLTIKQEQSSIRVYRGQLLSKQELKNLSQAVDQYISLNSFLSTSADEYIARIYIMGADTNVESSDEIPVIFEIEADPHQAGDIKPFANIAEHSQFPLEKEILFTAGSIFKIEQIINEPTFTRIQLKLCSNEENQLKPVFESLRHENDADLNSLGIFLYNMDKAHIADRFFRRLYHETSRSSPDGVAYCLNIGNAASHSDQYEEATRWYDRGFTLCDIHGIIDKPVLGILHLCQGNLHTKLKRRQQALESYDKALAILQRNFGENDLNVALCYGAMAIHFERRKSYKHALELRRKALDIAEKTLPPVHPDLAILHLQLAEFLFILKHRDLQAVLYHAQKAFDIGNIVFPPNNFRLLQIYDILCKVHSELRDFEQTLVWFHKAEACPDLQSADIREKTITYMCKQCHHVMWIYRYFQWMKDTRLNCLIFHVIPNFFFDFKRKTWNY